MNSYNFFWEKIELNSAFPGNEIQDTRYDLGEGQRQQEVGDTGELVRPPAGKEARKNVGEGQGCNKNKADTGITKLCIGPQYSELHWTNINTTPVNRVQNFGVSSIVALQMTYLQRKAQGNKSVKRTLRGFASIPKVWEIRSLKVAK